ncbi:MAG: hypothetical protein VYE18_01490, partial [Pseudomonadota bacterium]|nr:hypothetical protein [Pseudomonadota bacterium]
MFAGTSALGQVQSTTINCFFGLSALIFTDIAVAQQRDRPDSLSQEQQQEFFQTLTDNERRRFFSMNPEEKRTFVQSKMGGIKAGPGSGQ